MPLLSQTAVSILFKKQNRGIASPELAFGGPLRLQAVGIGSEGSDSDHDYNATAACGLAGIPALVT